MQCSVNLYTDFDISLQTFKFLKLCYNFDPFVVGFLSYLPLQILAVTEFQNFSSSVSMSQLTSYVSFSITVFEIKALSSSSISGNCVLLQKIFFTESAFSPSAMYSLVF